MDIENLYLGIKWVGTFFDQKEQPKFLLDPISTIVKLCMLKYKPANTKVRIIQHKLNFSDPWFFQGFNRWVMGDSRNNIQYLYLPIIYFCCLKFMMTNNPPTQPEYERILTSFNALAIEGLTKLKQTYVNVQKVPDLVVNCIELYIHLLSSDNKVFIKSKLGDINPTTIRIYDEFIKLWNLDNLEVIHKLFVELSNEAGQHQVDNILGVIDSYLLSINYKIDKLRTP